MLKKSFKTIHGYLCLKANMETYLKMPTKIIEPKMITTFNVTRIELFPLKPLQNRKRE